jgi:hypothetical protein
MEPKSNVACPSAGLWANKSRVTQLRANGPFLGRLRPLNRWPALAHCTVSQVQIDKVLIRHAQIGGHLLEVVYRCGIQSNGDLALELLCVRIFSRLRKIVITSHRRFLHRLVGSAKRISEACEIIAQRSTQARMPVLHGGTGIRACVVLRCVHLRFHFLAFAEPESSARRRSRQTSRPLARPIALSLFW